jgi:hypothetical protein
VCYVRQKLRMYEAKLLISRSIDLLKNPGISGGRSSVPVPYFTAVKTVLWDSFFKASQL